MAGTIVAGIIVALAILAALSIIWQAIRFGIGPMPSNAKAKAAIISLLRDQNIEGAVYECGAGWGTLAFAIAKKFPEAKIVAYEISPVPYLFLKLRSLISPRPNLAILHQDFLKADFSDAGCILCYLYPGTMKKLSPKLNTELKNGALIISNAFALPDWKPEQVAELDDAWRTRVYVYRV